MKNSPDHYCSFSVLHCQTLVPGIHFSAFRTTNRTSGITSKQIGFEIIAPKNLIPIFNCSRFVLFNNFQSDFPILFPDARYFVGARLHNPIQTRSYTVLTHHEIMFGSHLLTYFSNVLVCIEYRLPSDQHVLTLNFNLVRSHLPTFHFFTMWPMLLQLTLQFPTYWRQQNMTFSPLL